MVEEIWCEEDDELVGLEFELSFFSSILPLFDNPSGRPENWGIRKISWEKKKVGYTGSALKYWK